MSASISMPAVGTPEGYVVDSKQILFNDTFLIPDEGTLLLNIDVNGVPLRVSIACHIVDSKKSELTWKWKADNDVDIEDMTHHIKHPEKHTLYMTYNVCDKDTEQFLTASTKYLGYYNEDTLGFSMSTRVEQRLFILHIQIMCSGSY